MESRADYAQCLALDTRWMDNDAYGHVNNVVYYSFFDTAVNRWLVERGLLDISGSPTFGVVPTPMPTAIRAALESLRRAERDPLP